MCCSRGDETITKSIMVLTSPLCACMLSARETEQTKATIGQTDHILDNPFSLGGAVDNLGG